MNKKQRAVWHAVSFGGVGTGADHGPTGKPLSMDGFPEAVPRVE